MHRWLIVWLSLALSGLAACAPATGPASRAASPTPESGLAGTIWLGPLCPVQRADTPCPDQPFQATLTILNDQGARVAQVQSDAQGHFRLRLPPGVYTVRPEPPDAMTRAPEQTVTVAAGQFTPIAITYDSGLR